MNPWKRIDKRRQTLLEHLQRMQVTPFRDALATFLEAAPEAEHVAAFGAKAPDRWAQAVTMLAKLSGYRDTVDVHVTAQTLPDVELERLLAAYVESRQGSPGMVEAHGMMLTDGPLGDSPAGESRAADPVHETPHGA